VSSVGEHIDFSKKKECIIVQYLVSSVATIKGN